MVDSPLVVVDVSITTSLYLSTLYSLLHSGGARKSVVVIDFQYEES